MRSLLWRRAPGGFWGVPRPSVAAYVAMTKAHGRGDHRQMPLMSASLPASRKLLSIGCSRRTELQGLWDRVSRQLLTLGAFPSEGIVARGTSHSAVLTTP